MCRHVSEEEYIESVEVLSRRVSNSIKDPVEKEKWDNASFDARVYFLLSKIVPI